MCSRPATPSRARPPSPRSGTRSGTADPAPPNPDRGRPPRTGIARPGVWERILLECALDGFVAASGFVTEGGGAGPPGRRLGGHDPLLPEASAALAARPHGADRLVRPRAPGPADPHP